MSQPPQLKKKHTFSFRAYLHTLPPVPRETKRKREVSEERSLLFFLTPLCMVVCCSQCSMLHTSPSVVCVCAFTVRALFASIGEKKTLTFFLLLFAFADMNEKWDFVIFFAKREEKRKKKELCHFFSDSCLLCVGGVFLSFNIFFFFLRVCVLSGRAHNKFCTGLSSSIQAPLYNAFSFILPFTIKLYEEEEKEGKMLDLVFFAIFSQLSSTIPVISF